MINIIDIIEHGKIYLMDSEYKRIKDGKRIGVNKQPYSIKLYDNLIRFYENEEEYEKCGVILKQRNIILDHDGNYKWN